MALYGTPKFNTRDTIAVGSSLNPPASSFTLTGGNFGSPSGTQILVVDWDNNSKAVVISCTIVGTAVTSVTYLDGAVAANHAAGANVTMAFTPSQYTSVIDGSGWTSSAITLGYAQVTADQATPAGDLTGLTTTVTVPNNGRRIKISFSLGHQATTADCFATDLIIEDGATIDTINVAIPLAGVAYNQGVFSFTKVPSAGSHTYKLSESKGGGTGTITMKASAASPAWILVELI